MILLRYGLLVPGAAIFMQIIITPFTQQLSQRFCNTLKLYALAVLYHQALSTLVSL